jgi:FMN phosphatase YigB (HAD superfamily)
MTLNTILFDLDGTLLPFDHEAFFAGYFKSLLPHIAHLVDKDKIVDQIWAATMETVQNEDPNLTNMEVFKQSFLSKTGLREEEIWPIFDKYYEESFSELRILTEPTPISKEICRTLHDKGYRLVLATNPIFPEAAIRHRMRWAGIDDIPFALVTTMEKMHYCKPNPKYFIEILDIIDETPNHCMMIGNDVQEDGVAGKLGMQTFLVRDMVIDRGLGHLEFTYEGSLEDVLHFVRNLPSLGSSAD